MKKEELFKRKWKRSLIYSVSGKKVETELTYDYFSLHLDHEWWFRFRDHTIDIATHYDGKKVYELNIDGYDEDCAVRFEFDSPQELLACAKIDGKTLKEIWEDLEN